MKSRALRGLWLRSRSSFPFIFLFLLCGAVSRPEEPLSSPDEKMSAYRATEASGAICSLEHRLAKAEANLEHDGCHGYLLSLLRELKISPSSQLLVASKTSPNRDFISPHRPRAIFYNDTVSIAYVPTAPHIEIAAADPRLGVVFYTLEQEKLPRPHFVRDDRCLECHATSKTLGIPGLFVRSFSTKDDGEVDLLSGLIVNHSTPISGRWGGYYVTGLSGKQPHRGNLFASQKPDDVSNRNITDLSRFLDTGVYPAKTSDIVALLVLEHQTYIQNLMTRLNTEAASALREQKSIHAVHPEIEVFLKYALFSDEVKFISPICGSPEFAGWFQNQSKRDARGRSLRDFDLQTHLFRYRCSYTICSPSFDALLPEVKKRIYRRLWEILNGEDKSASFASLDQEERNSIREILVSTKLDLPEYWRL
jgi:hypothetical protein